MLFPGPVFFLCGRARSQPMRKDVIYVAPSLIGLDIAQQLLYNSNAIYTTEIISM